MEPHIQLRDVLPPQSQQLVHGWHLWEEARDSEFQEPCASGKTFIQ